MSATEQTGPALAPAAGAILCPRCGSVLEAEQAWCVECGLAARTRIHPPPSWRMPFATTLVLLVLLVAGISLALVALLDTTPATSTPAAATATAPATVPATTAPAATVPQTAPVTPPATSSVPSSTVPPMPVPGSALPQGGSATTTP